MNRANSKFGAGSGRAGLTGNIPARNLQLTSPVDPRFLANESTRQFDLYSLSRESYVCSQLRLTDDRGTHAEKKGPLYDVKPQKLWGKKARLGNPGNGYLLDGRYAHRPGRQRTNRTYLLRRKNRLEHSQRLNLSGSTGMCVCLGGF